MAFKYIGNITNIKHHEYDADQLPAPTGWRILVEPIDIEETTAGGIVLAKESVQKREYNRYVGKVISMGPDCYNHEKFPSNSVSSTS